MARTSVRRITRLGLASLAVVVGAKTALVAGGTTASAGEPLTTTLVASGLAQPTFLGHAPDDESRIFILEKAGRVRIMRDGELRAVPFLDITALVANVNEAGLLGLAFHPDHARNGKFYLHYTAHGLLTTIAEYEVSASDPDIANPASAKVLLTLDGLAPYHYGGWLGFGPADGYLYVALGERGANNRPQVVTDDLLGKILRIDVNGDDYPADPERNYALPPDNPFVGSAGDDEIWVFGLRNPYRASFDRETGDLWIGDVGELEREEIDFQPASSAGGENYGWGCMEGTLCNGQYCVCNDTSLTPPIHEYEHDDRVCAVIGGAVYRGCAIPDLAGTYFFADLCSGIWSFRYEDGAITEFEERTAELTPPGLSIDSPVAIGEDARGELYFVEFFGEIYKIVPASAPADLNGNGLADSCEPGDIDGDGTVGFADLTRLLLAWGPCDACIEDLDGDGNVGFADLTTLLLNWG